MHISKKHDGLQDYYHKFFPKLDLFTKEPIVFHTFDQYFDRDFNSKENLARWCLNESLPIVREYVLDLIARRLKKKNQIYVPSQVELKSLFLPSWFGLASIFGSVEGAEQALKKQFKLKFNYSKIPNTSTGELQILIDTREQKPLSFANSKQCKLTCGDYTAAGNFHSDVYIERKSLNDLFGTLTAGKTRFIREIERAKELGYYLVVLIEDTFENALNLTPQNSFSKSSNGKHLLYEIRAISGKYDNIQFVFSGNRERSKDLIQKIFLMREGVKEFDLEFLKDFNLI